MAVTDYKFSSNGTNVDRDGKAAWSNPQYAQADDSNNAVVDVAKNTYSDWLQLDTYGFTTGDIPAGSTIDGIEVEIGHYGENSTNLQDSALYLRKTSGQVGNNNASGSNWNSSPIASVTYGGSTDKWGTTWNESDIVGSTGFGIQLSANNSNALAQRNAYVDYIKIRVYYTYTPPVDNKPEFFPFLM